MKDCESCIHYPPSAALLLNCYQRKDDDIDA